MKSARRHLINRPVGFTLVELLIVIVIMAILTAVIVPEMKGMLEGELLHSTSRKLTRALGTAYRESVTSNRPHRLRIDTSRGRFLIERRATLEESTTGFVPLTDTADAQGTWDRRIRLEIAEIEEELEADESPSPLPEAETDTLSDAILFKPDGTTERREIRLRDRQGFGFALRLNPITARVKLVTLDRE